MIPYIKVALKNLFSKPSTVQFPNKVTDVAAKPGYRGRIAFDPEKCINCGKCEKVCSPMAITTTREEVEGGTKIIREFDLTSCTFCGTCADFCDEGAITMTPDYHMVATDPRDLIVHGEQFREASKKQLTKSDACIYCTLCAKNCPQEAITVDRANKTWEVDHEKCVQCGICVSKCPKAALSFEEPKPAQLECDSESCIYCTLCARNCPQEAITVDRANKTWEVDHEKCVQCGICVNKCPKSALDFK